MWTYYLLIWATYLFLFAGTISAILLTVSFTQGQRRKFPLLKRLDGRQIHLSLVTILFLALGYGAYAYKDTLILNLSFELSRGPGEPQAEKATPSGFELELKKATDERSQEAADFFRTAERSFNSMQYQDAATNYRRSIEAVPTLSAYLNLGVALRYLADYPAAEPVLLKGLQYAKSKGEKKFEANFLFNLGFVYYLQGKLDEGLAATNQSLDIFKQTGDKLGIANALSLLALGAKLQGNMDGSLRLYNDALGIYQDINNELG